MNTNLRTEYGSGDSRRDLLSAETAARLSDGDEYLDLDHLDQGVRRMLGTTTPRGRVLAKKAVREIMWTSILAQLAAPRIEAAYSGAR